MRCGTEVNASQLGVRRSGSRWNLVGWKQHFLVLLTRKVLVGFHQACTNDVLCDRDEYIEVRRSKFNAVVE